MFEQLASLINPSRKIVVIVANNPDADALGSALALEDIFTALEKQVQLYCRSEIPAYLRFLDGWERFSGDFAPDCDLAVMVDNSAKKLLGDEADIGTVLGWLRRKPLIILDHHASESDIDFASLIINWPQMAATGQLIYEIAKNLNWPLSERAATYLAASILSDSLGFTSQSMIGNAGPLRVVADLVEAGVNLHELARKRLRWQEISPELVAYRGELLGRIRFYEKNRLAVLAVEYAEIRKLGSLFNPTVVLDEMRSVEGVKASLGFKKYEQGGRLFRVTLRIRCHRGCQIAKKLAETFGGGGHPYAAGAKWESTELDFAKIEADVLKTAGELLAEEA